VLSSIKFTFGQYKGMTPREVADINPSYLNWVLNNKIHLRYKGLKEAIVNAQKPDITIELEQTELPDLTVNFDDGIIEGVSASILRSDGYCTEELIEVDDQRSPSGKHGELHQILPAEDIVILVTQRSKISPPGNPDTTWMVRMDGGWNRIIPNNRFAAKAVLELML